MWLGGGGGGGGHVNGGEEVMDVKGEEEGETGCLKSEG